MTSAPHNTTTGSAPAGKSPNALAILFNFPKTLSLIKSVFQDARVHWAPKIVFTLSLGVLLLALLTPEVFGEIVGAIGLPLTAPLELLGIPVDGTIDWIVAAIAAFNLLRLFPSQVVDEHYDRIFSKKGNSAPPPRPSGTRVVDSD